MTKEERKHLYRTDLKEYKRLKNKERYEDMKVYKNAKEKERRYNDNEKRQTPERKAKKAINNMRYRDKKYNKTRPLGIEGVLELKNRKNTKKV